MAGLIVWLVIFGGLAFWASRDAKQRIAAGSTKQQVGGGPISVFIVVWIMPIIGGLFYLYKRGKDQSIVPKLK
jgi:hypothetical protein